MMLVADPMVGVRHGFYRQLSDRRCQRNQLAAGELLRGPAFVGIEVRHLRTEHGMVGPSQRLQSQWVGSGALKCEEDFHSSTEMVPKLPHPRFRVGIVRIP